MIKDEELMKDLFFESSERLSRWVQDTLMRCDVAGLGSNDSIVLIYNLLMSKSVDALYYICEPDRMIELFRGCVEIRTKAIKEKHNNDMGP